jgi:flavin reductase (DIM6/NTAB) family NADH-FMN oxidoreductase RutF
MQIDPDTLSNAEAYKLLTGMVVPRPIAWVTSMSGPDMTNAAPFSAFTFVSNKPPMVGISIGRLLGGFKDTARNIRESKEFVVNIADTPMLQQLHMSSAEYPPDVSEITELGIELAPSTLIETPRIAAAPISMECRLYQMLEFGELKSNFYIGEVVLFHIRDGLSVDGKIDTKDLDPIARLGGPNYVDLGDIVTMPTVPVTVNK